MSLAGEANTGAIPSDGLEGTLRVTQWAQQNQKSGASMHALALAFSPGSLTGPCFQGPVILPRVTHALHNYSFVSLEKSTIMATWLFFFSQGRKVINTFQEALH